MSFAARTATYSNYKKHNRVKVLIVVSPTGSIVYISKCMGRYSVRQNNYAGFLDLFEYGDVVLADRGFSIADELAIRGATLEIPAFTKGKMQFTQRRLKSHVSCHE